MYRLDKTANGFCRIYKHAALAPPAPLHFSNPPPRKMNPDGGGRGEGRAVLRALAGTRSGSERQKPQRTRRGRSQSALVLKWVRADS